MKERERTREREKREYSDATHITRVRRDRDRAVRNNQQERLEEGGERQIESTKREIDR